MNLEITKAKIIFAEMMKELLDELPNKDDPSIQALSTSLKAKIDDSYRKAVKALIFDGDE